VPPEEESPPCRARATSALICQAENTISRVWDGCQTPHMGPGRMSTSPDRRRRCGLAICALAPPRVATRFMPHREMRARASWHANSGQRCPRPRLSVRHPYRNRRCDLLFASKQAFSRILRSREHPRQPAEDGSRLRGSDLWSVLAAPQAEIQAMGRLSLSGPARFQRKVVRVLGVIPNAPTHRRDTIECALECGHARSVLRINRGETPIVGQCRDIIGAELQCAKCAVLERIRRKVRVRRNQRTLTGWATSGSGSGVAG
jgi:hypothetical protein